MRSKEKKLVGRTLKSLLKLLKNLSPIIKKSFRVKGYLDDYYFEGKALLPMGEGNFIEQEYLPGKIAGTKFYDPGKNAREDELRRFLRDRWKDKYGY